MTIWLKTCFWTWNSRKSKKLRVLLVQLLKVATGGHFQDSKFRIWLKHPGLSLVSFYAAGPFVAFSEYMNVTSVAVLQRISASDRFMIFSPSWYTPPYPADWPDGSCRFPIRRWKGILKQPTKGQLISECLFDILNFPKKQQKIWQISALESKKW